jgi:hypothetical protein
MLNCLRDSSTAPIFGMIINLSPAVGLCMKQYLKILNYFIFFITIKNVKGLLENCFGNLFYEVLSEKVFKH